jgi:hypothetical protein
MSEDRYAVYELIDGQWEKVSDEFTTYFQARDCEKRIKMGRGLTKVDSVAYMAMYGWDTTS